MELVLVLKRILAYEGVDIVKPYPVLCRGPQDQPFLDLAHSGKADLLITGNQDLLALAGETKFVIETPEAYWHGVCGPGHA